LSASPVLAVLFDAGGVLLRLDYAAIAARAAEHGFPIAVEALAHAEAGARRAIDARAARHGGVPGTDATRVPDYFDDLLAAAGVPAPARPELVGRLRADNRAAGLWRVPLEGAHETLAALRGAGLRTGVVSNADGRAALLLEQAGLAGGFDLIVDSHFEGVEKPDPEIFRRALARLGVAAEHTLFVGDIWSIDVEGSRAAGLRPILMDATGGYADRDCERIARLVELCERLGIGAPAAGRAGRGERT
jgi:putative hydrolase of the HAD superfamily